MVGGSALNDMDSHDNAINAFLMKGASFDDIMKLVNILNKLIPIYYKC